MSTLENVLLINVKTETVQCGDGISSWKLGELFAALPILSLRKKPNPLRLNRVRSLPLYDGDVSHHKGTPPQDDSYHPS